MPITQLLIDGPAVLQTYGFLFSDKKSRMPSIDYPALRFAVTIERVLNLLDFVPVERNADQVCGPCPIHRSKSSQSRSFSANLATNVFQCFTCGAKGNQLDLWSQARSLSLHDAASDLCERLRIDPPILGTKMLSPTEKRNP